MKCTKDPKFEIFGEESIIKDIKVNIESFQDGNGKLMTLTYNGNTFTVQNEFIDNYKIYFSYKDSLVGKMTFENTGQWAKDYINHLYIDKKGDIISAQYIDRKIDIEKRLYLSSTIFVSLDEYFEIHNINSDEEKEKEKKKFFNMYNF